MKHPLILVLLAVFMAACSKPKPHKKLFDGEIVYIRANSAKDGLEAGTFGDVMVSNGRGNTERITHDYAYDLDPFWIDNGKKILFVSGRSNIGMGVGRERYLLTYDRYKHAFINLDNKIIKINAKYKYTNFGFASSNMSGKDITFYFMNNNYKSCIALYNINRNKITNINIDSLGLRDGISDLRLSPDGDNVIFYNYSSNSDISIFNFRDYSVRNLLKSANKKSGENYIGTWINNNEFSFSFNKDSVSTIKSYNIDTDSVKTLAVIHKAYAYDPVVSLKQQKIIYIVSSKYYNGNIWVYDMKTGKNQPLTTDNHAVQDIDWCQSCSISN